MFWFIRGLIVIGVIFYLSPVRHTANGDGAAISRGTSDAIERLLAGPGPLSDRDWARVEGLWATLPESARAALLDRLRRTVLTARSDALGPDQARRGSDMLRAEDRQALWRGDLRTRLSSTR